jgi:hypothetical protein
MFDMKERSKEWEKTGLEIESPAVNVVAIPNLAAALTALAAAGQFWVNVTCYTPDRRNGT